MRNASRNSAPVAPARSAAAYPAESGATVGCVRSPKIRSGAFESCVSSKSIAWPAVPLARAASEAGARVSGGPRMVASVCPPWTAI